MGEELLDINEFLERVQDDKELLLELLDIFANDYIHKRSLLDQAIVAKDFEQIRNITHSLKGASGNISAKSMRQILLSLEEKGKNKDLSDADELLSRLDQIFENLKVRFDQVKKEFS